jgi:hypothetical protein
LYQDKNKLKGITIPKLYGILEAQQELNYLGYVLLTKEDVEQIGSNNYNGYNAGVLIKKELRKNAKGKEYYSCLLYPYEHFWSDNLSVKFELGDKIVVEKTSYGKLTKWKNL